MCARSRSRSRSPRSDLLRNETQERICSRRARCGPPKTPKYRAAPHNDTVPSSTEFPTWAWQSACRPVRRPFLDAKGGCVKPGRCIISSVSSELLTGRLFRTAVLVPSQMPLSRQERRKAERDAAKRAPAKTTAAGAGAGGAAGAAAALANLNVNQLGDWTTQAEDPAVGPGRYCAPRHRLSFNSSGEGSKCGYLRGERYPPGPTPRRCFELSEPRS